MPKPDDVLVDERDGVLTVTLNRPRKRNALTPDMVDRLHRAIAGSRREVSVRVIVLRAAGEVFCAGADLGSSSIGRSQDPDRGGPPDPQDVARSIRRRMHPLLRTIWELEKPVVAVVQGPSVGAGAQLALVADLVLAAQRATFAEIFVRRGLVVDSGGAYLLPRLVGLRRAKQIALLGETLEAATAAHLGLVNWVVADGDLDQAAIELVGRLSQAATAAVGATKTLMHRGLVGDLDASLRDEAIFQAMATQTEDFAEARNAHSETRPPRFRGV